MSKERYIIEVTGEIVPDRIPGVFRWDRVDTAHPPDVVSIIIEANDRGYLIEKIHSSWNDRRTACLRLTDKNGEEILTPVVGLVKLVKNSELRIWVNLNAHIHEDEE